MRSIDSFSVLNSPKAFLFTKIMRACLGISGLKRNGGITVLEWKLVHFNIIIFITLQYSPTQTSSLILSTAVVD
jgi:hypothetical protein